MILQRWKVYGAQMFATRVLRGTHRLAAGDSKRIYLNSFSVPCPRVTLRIRYPLSFTIPLYNTSPSPSLSMRCTVLPALLGLTTSVTAAVLPECEHARRSTTSQPEGQEFTLFMEVNDTWLPLTAINNGTADLVLQAGQPDIDPGTSSISQSTPDGKF